MSDPAVVEPAGAPPADPGAGAPPAVAAVPDADPPGNWFATPSENWRQDLVSVAGFEGDDADTRVGQLERVMDPATLAKNYFSAQDKIRAGEVSSGLPENATDEQLSAWREANGVPATVDDYDLQLSEGMVMGEDDTRIMAGVMATLHEGNVSNSVASAAVNAMLQGREVEVQLLQQQDGVDLQQTTQMLQDAWGHDFTTNTNMVQNLLELMPEAARDDFKNARMADGRGMLNSPEVMVFLADLARRVNPAGTVVPNSDNPVQAIDDEIKALEARMGDDDWHKDQTANDRLEQLYDAQERMRSKE